MPLGSAKVGLFGAAGVSTGGGDRGLKFLGMFSNAPNYTVYNVIEYITISSTGNGTDFGDCARYGRQPVGASNGVTDRGLICGGTSQGSGGSGGSGSKVNIIEYVTISSAGDSSNFGDYFGAYAGDAGTQAGGSNGSNDRAIFALSNSNDLTQIGYNTVSSAGDTQDFGNRTISQVWGNNGAFCSNGTNERGVFLGGAAPAHTPESYDSVHAYSHAQMTTMDYITINSAGNATDFGDLTIQCCFNSSCSNDTNERGISWGGYYYTSPSSGVTAYPNVIQYITINSAGNATDFGDQLDNPDADEDNYLLAHCVSNGVNERGCHYGGDGWNQNNHTNMIQYITINSTGNATDFGDALLQYGHCGSTDNGFT